MDTNKSLTNDEITATGGQGQQAHTPYRFTNEELRVLRQCNRESFYQRSLPFSSILSVGVYYAVKSGYMKGHPRFGPTPKVLVAATVGYFVGKFSYQYKCAEKLMQLSNSPIGEMLRQRRRQGGYQEILADHSSIAWPVMESTLAETTQDLDVDRPLYDGLDDFSRPTLDSPVLEEDSLPISSPQRSTSYEELRQKNREEYEHKRSKIHFRGSPTSDEQSAISQQMPSSSESPSAAWSKAKNKYGDTWEE